MKAERESLDCDLAPIVDCPEVNSIFEVLDLIQEGSSTDQAISEVAEDLYMTKNMEKLINFDHFKILVLILVACSKLAQKEGVDASHDLFIKLLMQVIHVQRLEDGKKVSKQKLKQQRLDELETGMFGNKEN